MSFACVAQGERSESVEVVIASGTCQTQGLPLYRTTIRRGQSDVPLSPPSLPTGTYAFSATASDGSGAAVTTVCREIALPRQQGVALVLPDLEGCKIVMSPQVDAQDGPDGSPREPGWSEEPDADLALADGGGEMNDASAAAEDGSVAVADASVPAADASVAVTDAGVPPDASPEPDAGATSLVYSFPTKDISLPKACWAPGEFMPVTIHNPVSAVDWLWVKNHPDYGGSDKEFWDYTGSTVPGGVYRGGQREPQGLHAPSTTGSFNITWHINDAGDKETRSTLAFTVSNSCP